MGEDVAHGTVPLVAALSNGLNTSASEFAELLSELEQVRNLPSKTSKQRNFPLSSTLNGIQESDLKLLFETTKTSDLWTVLINWGKLTIQVRETNIEQSKKMISILKQSPSLSNHPLLNATLTLHEIQLLHASNTDFSKLESLVLQIEALFLEVENFALSFDSAILQLFILRLQAIMLIQTFQFERFGQVLKLALGKANAFNRLIVLIQTQTKLRSSSSAVKTASDLKRSFEKTIDTLGIFQGQELPIEMIEGILMLNSLESILPLELPVLDGKYHSPGWDIFELLNVEFGLLELMVLNGQKNDFLAKKLNEKENNLLDQYRLNQDTKINDYTLNRLNESFKVHLKGLNMILDITEAQKLFDAGDFSNSLQRIESSLQALSNNTHGSAYRNSMFIEGIYSQMMYLQGQILVAMKNESQKAKMIFETLLKQQQGSKENKQQVANILNYLGIIEAKEGRFWSAVQKFKEAISKDEFSIAPMYNVALAYHQNDQYATEYQILEKLMPVVTTMTTSMAKKNEKKNHDSSTWIHSYYDSACITVQVILWKMAKSLIKSKKYLLALNVLQELKNAVEPTQNDLETPHLLSIGPITISMIHREILTVYLAMGQHSECIRMLENWKKEENFDVICLSLLAECHLSNNNLQEAKSTLMYILEVIKSARLAHTIALERGMNDDENSDFPVQPRLLPKNKLKKIANPDNSSKNRTTSGFGTVSKGYELYKSVLQKDCAGFLHFTHFTFNSHIIQYSEGDILFTWKRRELLEFDMLMNLGVVHQCLQEYPKALERFTEAKVLALASSALSQSENEQREMKNRAMTSVYNLVLLLLKVGKLDTACKQWISFKHNLTWEEADMPALNRLKNNVQAILDQSGEQRLVEKVLDEGKISEWQIHQLDFHVLKLAAMIQATNSGTIAL